MQSATEYMLDVHNLRKSYGTTQALDGVSFRVRSGEIFGLLGPNGAGKTTLMSIISGLLAPSSGDVLLAGHAFHRQLALRPWIGIVPQDLAIYPELTARENLHFFGQLYSVHGGELHRRVDQILAAIGLADRADQRAGTYSGGMKRRLNLGAALVHEPRLLLLDEPTTGVDPQSRNHIFEEVRRLNGLGMTIVYTSHYMEEVQALCPRIGIMDRGRLIACDEVRTLLARLPGRARVGVAGVPAPTRDRLAALPGVRVTDTSVEIESPDVNQAVLRIVALLTEDRVAMTSLQTQEPNLEHVFLHLTGHDLRD